MAAKGGGEKKSGGLLRWPWNIVIYILLAAVLRIAAIPVILILMWIQRKDNPHGGAEGYCLSRTRKKISWVLWGLLLAVIGAGLIGMGVFGMGQDRTYWEAADYVTLAVCFGGGGLLVVLGTFMIYTGARDTFFPAKSALAESIRHQLPYPEEAPPVEELFAMVDGDLKANGRWFDEMGVGKEWVLGEQATRVDRIRGIFTVDEIRQHRSGKRVNTTRMLQLVLIDDRWQKNITDFKKPQELQAAADYLALRAPDARRGVNGQWSAFWSMDESEREEFEQNFRQRQNRRASEQAQQESMRGGAQDMVFQAGDEVTSRVTMSLIEGYLRQYLSEGEGIFSLTPSKPLQGPERSYQALEAQVRGDGVEITLAFTEGGKKLGLSRTVDGGECRRILEGWLRREAPDTADWTVRGMYDAASRGGRRPQLASKARLSLVYASGAAENHTTFTREDVQAAAEGIVDGTYQLVDLTHSSGYMWIRVTGGDKADGRCTVETTKPQDGAVHFYSARMSPRQAAAWLIGYPHGEFLPGGDGWKDITRQMEKSSKK